MKKETGTKRDLYSRILFFRSFYLNLEELDSEEPTIKLRYIRFFTICHSFLFAIFSSLLPFFEGKNRRKARIKSNLTQVRSDRTSHYTGIQFVKRELNACYIHPRFFPLIILFLVLPNSFKIVLKERRGISKKKLKETKTDKDR